MWAVLAVCSAFFLGTYDIMKKASLNNNAVMPVLLVSSLSGAVLFTIPWILSKTGVFGPDALFYVVELSWHEHLLVFSKTMLVLSSWILAFFALKHLPITIVAPIRATAPLWTLFGALIIFSERLSTTQWIGISITLTFFFLFSSAGKREGISFRNNKYIWFIIAATLLGALSNLYDKYIVMRMDRMAMQTYFTYYQVVILTPLVMLLWWPQRAKSTPFQFRWTIPMIGILLAIADFLYFYAIDFPDSLISVIPALRRSSVIVAFVLGAIIFKDVNLKRKSIYLVGILIGIFLLLMDEIPW